MILYTVRGRVSHHYGLKHSISSNVFLRDDSFQRFRVPEQIQPNEGISKANVLFLRSHVPEPLHFNVGISKDCATMDDAILSPNAHIAPAGGPKKF